MNVEKICLQSMKWQNQSELQEKNHIELRSKKLITRTLRTAKTEIVIIP